MTPASRRWREITPSQYPWEQEALAYLRDGLPDADPIRVWSNFEFIADDSSIYEVDALVLTAKGLFLVEIKSWPGNTEATCGQWTIHDGGQVKARDNPYVLANRKAKKLASLLKRQRAFNHRVRPPFLQPLIFLSHSGARARVDPSLREVVFLRDREPQHGGTPRDPGILFALTHVSPAEYADRRRQRVDRPTMLALIRAMEDAGIRPSLAAARVGDYELGELLLDGPGYQDWVAKHVSIPSARRRVRIYGAARMGAEARQTIERAARREFEILEGIRHDGILRVHDFREHESGPALLFEHHPSAVLLNHFLAEQGSQLGVDQRLDLLRQMAEAIRYAHEKRLVHRALSPQSVLVVEPASSRPRPVIFNWQTAARDLSVSRGSSSGRTLTEHVEELVDDAAMPYMAPEVWTDPEASGETLDVFGLGAIAYHLFTGQPRKPLRAT